QARGMGGHVRVTWRDVTKLIAAQLIYTVKTHGPDRIAGFTPIPAMSMLSYAAGSRFISLIGGEMLSFYDWYADLPNASPQIWGDQTDVPESADWYNSNYLMMWGSNVQIGRASCRENVTGVQTCALPISGFTPIPAMSMLSYAAGSRFISLIGGEMLSFYDWYADLPNASPQIWGDQTDVPESADWYNSNYLMMWGSNV